MNRRGGSAPRGVGARWPRPPPAWGATRRRRAPAAAAPARPPARCGRAGLTPTPVQSTPGTAGWPGAAALPAPGPARVAGGCPEGRSGSRLPGSYFLRKPERCADMCRSGAARLVLKEVEGLPGAHAPEGEDFHCNARGEVGGAGGGRGVGDGALERVAGACGGAWRCGRWRREGPAERRRAEGWGGAGSARRGASGRCRRIRWATRCGRPERTGTEAAAGRLPPWEDRG